MLKRKLLRDIKINIFQFITIFLMVFLGVFVFSGIHAYMDGMKVSAEEYYKANNLQDIWLVKENFSKKDLRKIKNVENVKDAERVLTVNTSLKRYDDVTLETNFIETNNISKMYVVKGEKFKKGAKGVWVDSFLANNLGLKVGDEITFSYEKYGIKEKIKGLINTPDHVYSIKDETEIFPTHTNFGYVYLSINEFPKNYIYDELKKDMGIDDIDIIKSHIEDFDIKDYYVFNSVLVDIENEGKLEQTKSDLEDEIKDVLAVTDRKDNTSYVGYNSEIEEGNTYSGIFTMFFMFIALLSVVTTMNRFVNKERTIIGTLKALGFKDYKITTHYVSYGFVISVIASALGLILGKLTLGNYFLEMEMEYFEVPVYFTTIKPIVYYVTILIISLVTLATYFSCKKILRQSASEALRLMPKVSTSNFNISTKGIFKKMSLSTKWNLRDISRNKGRSAMGIVGITGACMLIVCAFGLLDSMNSYLDWEFKKLCNFDYKLTLNDDIGKDELNNLKEKYGFATSETLGIEVQLEDRKDVNTLTINDAKDYLKYTDHNRNYIDLKEDEVYITEKLSKTYNLGVGDNIKWHIYGDDTWYTTEIVGLNRDPQMQSLNMTRKFYESLDLEYEPDSLYTNKDLKDVKKINGVDNIQDIDSLKGGMENMLSTMKSLLVILIAVAVILGFVIIYNLGILSFMEKQYQFATLKVLGFKDNKIKSIFIKQNIWLTIIAIIIGLPLGFYMTDFIFKSALGDSYDFNAVINIISYIYAFVGTLIVSAVVNYVLSRKVNKIDMVSSLKGNE